MEEFTQCIKSDAKEIERTESFIRARGSSPLEGLFLIESTVAARHFPSHDRKKSNNRNGVADSTPRGAVNHYGDEIFKRPSRVSNNRRPTAP